MKIRRSMLMRARPENVRRLARACGLKHVDMMSHRQLCRLLHWLFTRREKRLRDMDWAHNGYPRQ